MDPWSINGLITPSEDLINLFQEWNKTKSTEKRLISYKRAKQWICRLLKKPVSIPQGHKMRQEDFQNALDHMINAHASGVTQIDYLQSCIDPKRSDNNEVKATSDTGELNEDEHIENDTKSVAEESKSEAIVINTNAAATSVTENGSSVPVSVASAKIGKICKHTWRGTKCQISDCQKIHIDPCQDRECRALDDGLPLYKSRNCPLWHVKSKVKKHTVNVHEGKKPFKSNQFSYYKRDKKKVKSPPDQITYSKKYKSSNMEGHMPKKY